jgi:hypothetical protein
MSAVDIAARGLAAKALQASSFTAAHTGAVTRTTTAKIVSDVPLSLLDFYDPADPDMTNAVMKLGEAIAAQGGNCRVIFPPAGAPYDTTQGLLITDPNVTIEIYNRLNYTGTTPQALIAFRGNCDDPAVGLLPGAKIFNHAVLDHNGLDIPWSYVTGQFFSTVAFEDCEAPVIRGGELWEGLMECLSFFRCRRPLAERVRAVGSVNDNGISFNYNPCSFDPDDPETWCNGVLHHCQSANNQDFGQTVYNATGCKIIEPESWNNGIDGTASETLVSDGNGQFVIDRVGANGGGISFEGGGTAIRLRAQLIGGRIYGNVAVGVSQTGDDVTYRNVDIEGVTTASTAVFQGHGLSVFAVANSPRFKVQGGRFYGAAKNGISARKTGTNWIDGSIGGEVQIEANGWEGICAQGISRFTVGKDVRLTGNCTDTAAGKINECYIDNTNANGGAGVARVSAWFEQPNQRCVYISNVGAAYITGAGAYKACKPGATVPFRIDTSGDLAVAEISEVSIAASINPPANIGQIAVIGGGVVTRSIVGANKGDHTTPTAVTSSATTRSAIAAALADTATGTAAGVEAALNALKANLRSAGIQSQ